MLLFQAGNPKTQDGTQSVDNLLMGPHAVGPGRPPRRAHDLSPPPMLDLASYRPKGDKRNSSFFEEYLPQVYSRRRDSGLDQLVGTMAALVIQVDHGHAIAAMAEPWRCGAKARRST